MDFSLNEKQKMLKKITREFAEEYLVPVAKESDEKQELDDTAFQKMKEMNYFGACIPEEYGGAGLHNDSIGFCIVIEEIGRADAAWGITTAVHNGVAAYPIYKYGTEEQKQKFLFDLAKGSKVGAFCLTEANAGSDAGGVQLTAEKDGDEWMLNGTKIFATSGGIAKTLLVVAKSGEKESRKKLTVFIVDTDTAGYSVGVKEDKLGVRASNTSELVFQDVRVPNENILGNNGEGFRMAMKILDFGRIGIAAQCVGYKAAYMHDNGMEFGMASSMAKLVASEAAMQAAHGAVQIHGGYGLMKAYPVERFFRDAKMGEIYEGTSEIQRLVISNHLLRRGF